MYDENMVAPMRAELTTQGFQELKTANDVKEAMAKNPKTALLFVNSVCGCAAGIARPGLIDAVSKGPTPELLGTAFAGNDIEGVTTMRDLFVGYAPSSPCIGIFREGTLVHVVERHQIEGQTLDNLSNILQSVFQRYCGADVDESIPVFDPLKANQVTVSEAKEKAAQNADVAFLDVREQWERDQGHIEGSELVDNDLANKIVSEWNKEREIVVYCAHGNRSLQAVQFLKQQGFKNVWSLEGGFAAWN